MTKVALSRIHYPVTTLGPGRRVGVWLQGCSLGCAGCISPDTWAHGRNVAELSDVIAMLQGWADIADGLTVSGGEPFEQPHALAALLTAWREATGADILVFTGLELEEVEPWLFSNPGLIDALITGPYDQSAPQTLALRGSDNQELHILTPAGSRMAAYERPLTSDDRKLDLMFDEDGGVWFAGIPARDDFRRLQRRLRAAGHRLSLAERPGTLVP